jgi:hypothetical protein
VKIRFWFDEEKLGVLVTNKRGWIDRIETDLGKDKIKEYIYDLPRIPTKCSRRWYLKTLSEIFQTPISEIL